MAQALDDVAVACSPFVSQTDNPAKMLAISLAESTPILWGGSVLAARAGRRIAESFRRSSGRAALSADAEHLLPILRSAKQHDVFADPFADDDAAEFGPALLILDDGADEATIREARGRLVVAAQERGVRVETIATSAPNDVARYAALLATGRYVATYLGVGLSG